MTSFRILFLTHLYAPSVGGAERVFQRLAEGLAARGQAVTVLTSDALSTEQYFSAAWNDLPRRERLNGVLVIRSPISAPIYTAFKLFDKAAKRLGRLGVFYRPLVFGPHFAAAFRTLLGLRFDAVIAGPVPTTAVFYGWLFRRLSRPSREARLLFIPCMHTRDNLHVSPANLWALRRADTVVTLSEDEKAYLAGRGIPGRRIFKLAAAVDEAIIQAPPAAKEALADYVLYLGQEGEHKRIPLLLLAMKRMWEKGRSERLVIAGARTYYSATIDRLIALLPERFRGRVSRIGDFPESRKIGLLDNCRMLVNPSSLESFGIVFLEAWARRKPVIGARIKAVREIIRDGENGFLFEDKDARDLEDKIRRLADDSALAARLGETGYKDVIVKYRWDGIVSGFLDTLNRI
jgi:glycosyltransferase involved in cell wall biosynthesis